MNSSRLLSIAAVGIAIVVTVPFKLNNFTAVQQTLSANLEQASAALLAREGYKIEIDDRFGFFVINGQQNQCQLQIREAAPEGFNTEAIKAHAPKDAELSFEYRGKLWTSPPTYRATLSKSWNRLKWALGVDNSWSPVIAVAAVGSCAIDTLPWDELASIHAN